MATRDALIVSLARSKAVHDQLLSLARTLRKFNDHTDWCLFCAQQVENIAAGLEIREA